MPSIRDADDGKDDEDDDQRLGTRRPLEQGKNESRLVGYRRQRWVLFRLADIQPNAGSFRHEWLNRDCIREISPLAEHYSFCHSVAILFCFSDSWLV